MVKRTRYDSEYERVRRDAGLGRVQPEFPEPIDFDKPVDLDRIEAAHDDFKERMAVFAARESAEAVQRKINADELSKRANASVLLDEYRRAGVTPPRVNLDGEPMVSLSLLLSMGWTIQDVSGKPTLIQPHHVGPVRKEGEHYDGSS